MLCILKALCILLKVYTEPYWRKTDDVENAATIGSVYRKNVRLIHFSIFNFKEKIHCCMAHSYHVLT